MRKASTPSRRPVSRRQLGLGSLALGAIAALPRGATAQVAVDRKDTLIIEAWPPGPTYRNHGNLNPFTADDVVATFGMLLQIGPVRRRVPTTPTCLHCSSRWRSSSSADRSTGWSRPRCRS